MALLNDLFGIQARGGCSCAGPYGHRLLGIDPARSHGPARARSAAAATGIKPGWVRVSFNYFISDAVGRLPRRRGRPGRRRTATGCSPTTASTRTPASGATATRPPTRRRRSPACSTPGPPAGPGAGEDALAGYLEEARALLGTAGPVATGTGPSWLPPDLERLRDFHLPPLPA